MGKVVLGSLEDSQTAYHCNIMITIGHLSNLLDFTIEIAVPDVSERVLFRNLVYGVAHHSIL